MKPTCLDEQSRGSRAGSARAPRLLVLSLPTGLAVGVLTVTSGRVSAPRDSAVPQRCGTLGSIHTKWRRQAQFKCGDQRQCPAALSSSRAGPTTGTSGAPRAPS